MTIPPTTTSNKSTPFELTRQTPHVYIKPLIDECGNSNLPALFSSVNKNLFDAHRKRANTWLILRLHTKKWIPQGRKNSAQFSNANLQVYSNTYGLVKKLYKSAYIYIFFLHMRSRVQPVTINNLRMQVFFHLQFDFI